MSGHGGQKLPFTSDKQRSSQIPPQARNAMTSNLKSCHRGLNQSIASDKRPATTVFTLPAAFVNMYNETFVGHVWMTVKR